MSKSDDDREVYRDEIEIFRDPYYVTYFPAQKARPLAIINVVYRPASPPAAEVRQAMESELRHWWNRYAVPSMVMAFAGDEMMRFDGGDDYLLGFPRDGTFQLEWSGRDKPQPEIRYLTPEELAKVYSDLPFRLPSLVRKKAIRELVGQARAVKTIVFLTVGFPLLIEIAALGVTWLGHVMAAVSLIAGFWKLGRTFGWIKPSQREVAEAEEERQMRHHHYHCKKNPDAFLALKTENFRKELAAQDEARFERIRSGGAKKP